MPSNSLKWPTRDQLKRAGCIQEVLAKTGYAANPETASWSRGDGKQVTCAEVIGRSVSNVVDRLFDGFLCPPPPPEETETNPYGFVGKGGI